MRLREVSCSRCDCNKISIVCTNAVAYDDAMEDKEAVAILIRMLEKESLSAQEREALKTAVGLLGWTKLIEGRMKSIKRSRDRRNFDDA